MSTAGPTWSGTTCSPRWTPSSRPATSRAVVRLLRLRRPARPPARPARLPDAIWMRAGHVRMFEHAPPSGFEAQERGDEASKPQPTSTPSTPPPSPASRSSCTPATPTRSTSPTGSRRPATCRPPAAYLRLRELNPAPYAGFLQHDVAGARAWLLSSSPERYALVTADRTLETKPIKGTTPRGRRRRGRGAPAPAGGRPQVPRREPDDRRPAPQRPVDGLQARHGRGADADGGGVLRDRAPAGVDGPRPAPRPGQHGRGAARALPGRLDDRCPQAAHHADHRRRRVDAAGHRTPAPSAGSPATGAPTSAS